MLYAISQWLTFVALIPTRRSFSKFKAHSQRRRGIKEEEDNVVSEMKLSMRRDQVGLCISSSVIHQGS